MYYVYILASKQNGTLYTGITGDLPNRIYQHKNKLVEGFSKQYDVSRLVRYEQTSDVHAALKREKQLKNRKRARKIALIEEHNKAWKDLYDQIIEV